MRHDERLDARTLGRRNVRDDQVLVRRQAEFAAMHARDLAQTLKMRRANPVGDASGLDAQGQMEAAVFAFGPAETVAVVFESKGTRGRERKSGAPLDLGLEPGEAAI